MVVSIAGCGTSNNEQVTIPTEKPMETVSSDTESESSKKPEEEEQLEASKITIKDVFYGKTDALETLSESKLRKGYSDLFIVFDADNESKWLPHDLRFVSAMLDDKTKLSATEIINAYIYDGGIGNFEQSISWFERYSGIWYLGRYSDIFGESNPIRMFIHFSVKSDDLEGAKSIKLIIESQEAEYEANRAKKINTPDEIIKVNGDFKSDQILAAEKWRIDTAYYSMCFLPRINCKYGEDFRDFSKAMTNNFSKTSGGLSVFREPKSGFSMSTKTFNKIEKKLPQYNHEVIKKGFPKAIKDINKLESLYKSIARMIVSGSTKSSSVWKKLKAFEKTYNRVCKKLKMKPINFN